MSELKGQALCDAYRAELRRVYGDEVANKSKVYHIKGWYYYLVAQTFRDGSVGATGPSSAIRRKQLLEMLHNLQGREPRETNKGLD